MAVGEDFALPVATASVAEHRLEAVFANQGVLHTVVGTKYRLAQAKPQLGKCIDIIFGVIQIQWLQVAVLRGCIRRAGVQAHSHGSPHAQPAE